jgi:DNA modification methylase
MYIDYIIGNKPNTGTEHTLFELLNSDFDFANNNTNNPIHNWHAFPAKFPPQIPELFIKNLTHENDIILDPMMGSCTTLLEAVKYNRNAIGYDIDPLSILIGKAKFANVEITKIEEHAGNIINNAKINYSFNPADVKKELVSRFDKETSEFLDYWFLEETQLELLSLLIEIEKIHIEEYQLFFKLVFSSIIITKSGGVSLSYDLAHTRPHKVAKQPSSPFLEFSKKVKKIANKFSPSYVGKEKISIDMANIKSLPLKDKSINLIVTSPPYANNAIDYIRAHKFSLVWFGHSISELKKIRRDLIGSENLSENCGKDFPEFTTAIIEELKCQNEKKSLILSKYYGQMRSALKEMYRVLKNDSAAIIVVASSVLANVDVKTHLCLGEIGENVGFKLIKIASRNLDRNKRMMPASFKKSNSGIEARMHTEFILGFYKA